jgi:hypothetical protein
MNTIQQKFNEIFEKWNIGVATPMQVKTSRSFAGASRSPLLSIAYNSFSAFKSMLKRGYDLFWIDTDGVDSPFAGAPKKLLAPPEPCPKSPFIVLDSLGAILRNPVKYKIDWNGFNGHFKKQGWTRLSDGSLVSAIPGKR